jgi:hypothetical protein
MKSNLIKLSLISLLALLVCGTLAFAEPQSLPNGPYIEEEQGEVALSSLMTNEELYHRLFQLAERSKGVMTLELAGYSNAINFPDLMEPLGYPLYVCKFGEPDPSKVRMLITTQIHGNEPLGTEAVIEIMQSLIGGGKAAQAILDKVTIWIMPRINPDGAINQYEGQWIPKRYTDQEWIPEDIGLPAGTRAPWYYTSTGSMSTVTMGRIFTGPGYDENRDSNPNLDFRIENLADYGLTPEEFAEDYLDNRSLNNSNYGGYYVTPEARIVTGVFKELQPDVYIDIHHRGFNYLSNDDIRQVSIQVAAEVADPYDDPFTGNHYEVDADVLTLAKQVNAVGWLSLQLGNSEFGSIQKYPKVNLPGTTLGAFALNDTAIMLIEISGQTQTLGQKANGKLIKTAKDAVVAIMGALADGSIHDVDTAIYDAIPESAHSISDPTTRDEELEELF